MSDEEYVRVTWFDHGCDFLTKFCDEHHARTALVPLDVLRKYEDDGPGGDS